MGITDEELEDDEDMFISLELDDDSTLECRILNIFTVEFEEGEQDYISMIPVDENEEDNEEGEVLIYRYFEDEYGEPSIENIEDDEEFNVVSDVFDQIIMQQSLDEED